MARLHSKPVIEEITDKEEYFEKLLDAYHGDAVEMISSAVDFLQRKGRLPREIAQEMTKAARGGARAETAGVRAGFLGSSNKAANGVQSNKPDKVQLSCCFLLLKGGRPPLSNTSPIYHIQACDLGISAVSISCLVDLYCCRKQALQQESLRRVHQAAQQLKLGQQLQRQVLQVLRLWTSCQPRQPLHRSRRLQSCPQLRRTARSPKA